MSLKKIKSLSLKFKKVFKKLTVVLQKNMKKHEYLNKVKSFNDIPSKK